MTEQPTAAGPPRTPVSPSGSVDRSGRPAARLGRLVATLVAFVLLAVVTVGVSPSPTSAVDSGSVSPANVQYRGVHTIHTLVRGQVQADVWTNNQITFFAPPGRVPVDVGLQWSEWYRQVDELYKKISNMSNFYSVYRRNDGANFGPGVKVTGFQESCGAGCGNKTQAEADPGYLTDALANPNDPLQWGHWVIYYEMARGGQHEPFYGRATWPTNTVLMPHLMAGISFHHFGGDAGMEVGIVGHLMQGLRDWEQMDHEWVEWFRAHDQQQIPGAPPSHDLMAAMLYNVMIETDVDVVARIIDEMTAKPSAGNATQAMCDFQDSIMAQTGDRFVGRMKGPWGLPDNCPGHPEHNNPPEVFLTWPGYDLVDPVGASPTITVRASDPDGDPVTFSATGLPPGMTIDSSDGTMRGTLSAPCNCRVTVIATDSRGATGSAGFNWIVEAPAPPPEPDPEPDPVPGSISGSALDTGGVPVAGVAVDLFTSNEAGDRLTYLRTMRTGADGDYRFDVEPGCYVVTFVAPDDRPFADGGQWLNAGRCVTDGEDVGGVDALLQTAGSPIVISGQVTRDGVGVDGVVLDVFTMAADGSRQRFLFDQTTAGGGAWSSDLGAGCYVVTFIAPDGETFVGTGTGWANVPGCGQPGETVTGVDAVLTS